MSNKQDSQLSQPIPCALGCGFYGNPLTENMCSKCYKSKQNTPNASQDKPTQLPEQLQLEKEEAKEMPPQEIQPVQNLDTAKQEESPATPQKPVQAHKNRCWTCNKKIGLLGFACKCDYVFCADHRHAEAHKCEFDYKSEQQQRLKQANPLVQAEKVAKI